MKILQINKFYYQTGKAGGTAKYFFCLRDLLRQAGHQIMVFAMKDSQNLPSPYSAYFVEKQDFSAPKLAPTAIKQGLRLIYSLEAKKKISQLLSQEKPDIVHIHNIYHHITPSILPVFKKHKIPTVQTLHDFHLISPNYNLYFKGKIHENCSKGSYWKAVAHKCVKNSRLASLLAALRMYYEKISQIYVKNIDYFISPSEFLRQKYIENGFSPKQVTVVRPFLDNKNYEPKFSPGKYILYFGRLHEQKGILTLLKAAEQLPKIPFKIVGEGEESGRLRRFIKEHQLKNVSLLGAKYNNELKEIIQNAACVVVPSLSYENAPFAVLEAFALGKPVIASNIGGLPELVLDGKTGFLFKAGNADDLKEKILKLYPYPCLMRTMGLQARLMVERSFSPEEHYKNLIAVYQKAIEKSSGLSISPSLKKPQKPGLII